VTCGEREPRGALRVVVGGIFMLLEACIWLVLLPVRTISVFAGRGLMWALKLPFRILALVAQLMALLVAMAALLLVVVAVLNLLGVL